MIELIKKILLFLSGLRPAPIKNEPVLDIVPAPAAPWISLEQFRKATGLSAAKSVDWYQYVRAACLEFGIVGPVRIAAFLAQVGHESGGFVHTREIWGPTPAQLRYEGRPDLGNTNVGDGARFRGRGLIQITGRANYRAVFRGLGIDFLGDPSLLESPVNAARSAAWWWANNGCNEIADTEDFLALSRRINLGNAKSTKTPNGMPDRLKRWDLAKQHTGGGDA